ncbi:MAG: hypothetical protein ACI9XP_001443 [Lentimonas sp.]|jgi:hypothetical protein
MSFLQKAKGFVFNKSFLKLIGIIVGVYFLVIGITVFYLDSYTLHGQQIEVPNLKGKNVKTIQPILDNLNLRAEVLDSIYDPKLAEGTIVSQDPEASQVSKLFVKEGRTIKVRVSKRSRLVEVPMLIDKSQRYAETVLLNNGLKFSVSYRNTQEAHGAVLDQTYRGKRIAKEQKIPIGSMINIVVGRNEGGMPVQVPDLYGMTIKEAKDRLANMPGLNFFPVCLECVTAQDSLVARVSSQSPQYIEGEMSPGGSTVTVNATLNFQDNRMPQ